MLVFCDVSVRKVFKHVSTRWLSLHKSLERSLDLWDGLRSYFLTYYNDDGDDQHDDDHLRGNEPQKRKRKVASTSKGGPIDSRDWSRSSRIQWQNCMFISYMQLEHTTETETPMIHKLHSCMKKRAVKYCNFLQSTVSSRIFFSKLYTSENLR